MDAEPRGYCVIFNNINFTPDFLTTRKGSQKDADDLENLFSCKLGFKVLRYNDMPETEMMQNMEALREKNHDMFCAFVVIILSHGDRGIIYSSDSKKIPIKNISNMFTASNCPSLRGKPKIFIIQACQGHESMKAIAAKSYQNEYLTTPKESYMMAYSLILILSQMKQTFCLHLLRSLDIQQCEIYMTVAGTFKN